MELTLLPLFPLQVVLFPRSTLPLHIFEDRYKELIGDVLQSKSEFGIVLAGEKGICNTGCTAVVDKVVERYPDGRLDLISIGRRRFEILSLNDEKPYLRGEVEFFDDEEFEPVPDDLRERVLENHRELLEVEQETAEPDAGADQISFKVAQLVPDLNFRQMLISTRSELGRMKQLAEFFPPYIARQRQVRHIRAVAPKNGHGKWPAGE